MAHDNNFKSFEFNAKLLGTTVAQAAPNAANGILKSVAISVPLKYSGNF